VMRLTNPNDELGGMMFLATPQVVSHRIDPWSPMCPPIARSNKKENSASANDGDAYHFPGLVFREADREVAISDEGGAIPRSNTSDGTPSPALVPSETPDVIRRERSENACAAPSFARAATSAMLPPAAPVGTESPAQSSGSEFAATGPGATDGQLKRMRMLIKEHMERSHLEIIVIVEAIDPHSSNTFQARHSYTSRDIEFDKSFCGCMTVAPDGLACLDWELFHTLKDVPFNASHIIGSSHS
jgi:hypothetical protein